MEVYLPEQDHLAVATPLKEGFPPPPAAINCPLLLREELDL